MLKLFNLLILLCLFTSTFAQKDMTEIIGRLEKQAVEIDSLKRLFKSEMDSRQQLTNENNLRKDSLKLLRLDLSNLNQIKNERKIFDSILGLKIDSISFLKLTISERDNQILAAKRIAEKNIKDAYASGKNEILANVTNRYKGQSFDALIKSSTKQSILLDLQICHGIPDVSIILSEMQKIFIAKELLEVKIDASQVKSMQSELSLIRRESSILLKLKEIIGNYQSVNDGLKELVERIIALDKREEVSGMSNEIKKKKLDKILPDFSSFIFNYDFNFSDYPYLADILLQVIKRKQPNPDADISDLLKKL